MLNYFILLYQTLLKKVSLRLYRKTAEGKYGQIIFSQEGEDIIISRLFYGRKKGFYVDVGAHHPFRFSNTYLLYKRGWRGINIDATPLCMELFEKYRTGDINLNMGISDIEENLTYYLYNESALNTFSKDLVKRHENNTQYHVIGTKEIKVKPLSAILKKHINLDKKIDLLTIDVEGYDLNVLKSNDWLLFRPSVIIIESHYAEIENITKCPIYQFLIQKDYKIISKLANSCIYIEK